jgi:hypothetical protein
LISCDRKNILLIYLTKQDDMDIDSTEKPSQEIEVTEEMIEAGVKRFCLLSGSDVTYDAVGDLLEEVFREMASVPLLSQKAGN